MTQPLSPSPPASATETNSNHPSLSSETAWLDVLPEFQIHTGYFKGTLELTFPDLGKFERIALSLMVYSFFIRGTKTIAFSDSQKFGLAKDGFTQVRHDKSGATYTLHRLLVDLQWQFFVQEKKAKGEDWGLSTLQQAQNSVSVSVVLEKLNEYYQEWIKRHPQIGELHAAFAPGSSYEQRTARERLKALLEGRAGQDPAPEPKPAAAQPKPQPKPKQDQDQSIPATLPLSNSSSFYRVIQIGVLLNQLLEKLKPYRQVETETLRQIAYELDGTRGLMAFTIKLLRVMGQKHFFDDHYSPAVTMKQLLDLSGLDETFLRTTGATIAAKLAGRQPDPDPSPKTRGSTGMPADPVHDTPPAASTGTKACRHPATFPLAVQRYHPHAPNIQHGLIFFAPPIFSSARFFTRASMIPLLR